MQPRGPSCCVRQCGPAQWVQTPHRFCRSLKLRANRPLAQQLHSASQFGSRAQYRHVALHSWHSTRQQMQICQAAQPRNNESFEATSDLPASSSSSAMPSNASVDDSRQASNAAASTSATQPTANSWKDPDKNSFRHVLTQPVRVLAALFQRLANFIRSLPAYIQREKLQRLHRKALDDPLNAER